MSFIDRQELFEVIEGLMAAVFELIGETLVRSFPRLSYTEAMDKYGSDKPDLRVPLEMKDLTGLAAELSSEVIRKVIDSRGRARGASRPGRGRPVAEPN